MVRQTQEITYTFTREDCIKALCAAHDINLPESTLVKGWWECSGVSAEPAIKIYYDQTPVTTGEKL